MNANQHRSIAVDTLGVSPATYDQMNAENDSRNETIRAARREYTAALMAGDADQIDAAGAKLDALVASK